MIKIEDVWFSYPGMTEPVLSNLNFEIHGGEYISVIGENGSGKSTLVRLLLGFLKPTKGRITMEEHEIGYVPQRNDFTNSNFPVTVEELLNSYRKLLKIKDRTVIDSALTMTGMLKFKKHLVGNLSGGQMQKILISRAIMGMPKVLILDEPSTGVDASSQKEIYGLLKTMTKEKNITIISVEHNLNAVFSNSTKIFHIQNGHGHMCSPEKYTKEYLKYQSTEA